MYEFVQQGEQKTIKIEEENERGCASVQEGEETSGVEWSGSTMQRRETN